MRKGNNYLGIITESKGVCMVESIEDVKSKETMLYHHHRSVLYRLNRHNQQ